MASLKWWQEAVFYQIYPRSFADGNGDGIGDIPGMIDKLDYLQSLGIGGIWLSPHYPSPQVDCGYDISNYTAVDPDYGTLEDFKTFLDAAHRRGIRVILDMVLNHTSDQHNWFIESRSSRDHPRRDWYIWKDPKPDGSPPNNWDSTFGGPAWEWDAQTGQYYYHFFFKEQPDLNWRNPAVKQAMFDAMRFWLDLGVDGFRLDAIGTVFEDPAYPDQHAGITLEEFNRLGLHAATPQEQRELYQLWEKIFVYQHDQPGTHELMRELRALIDEYDDRVLVGETDDIAFYGSGEDELHMIFNFPLMRTPRLTPQYVRENQETRLSQIPSISWPCNTLGNHDSQRMLNRFGDGLHDEAIARQNLVLLLALKGTPFLYNGEEIGMSDYLLSERSQFRDMISVWHYDLFKNLFGFTEEKAVQAAAERGRDRNRTPNQWNCTANAGFSPQGVTTWLPVNPNYALGINVEDQEHDPDSLLSFYRSAIHMRQENPALLAGEYQPLRENNPDVFAFLRTAPEQRCLVAVNMCDKAARVKLNLPFNTARMVFLTSPRESRSPGLEILELAPFEALVLEVA